MSAPSHDAVLLPNGNIAIALGQVNEVALVILDSGYNIITGPTFAATTSAFNPYMSVTYDTSNNIVMTWLDDFESTSANYALADPTGSFISNPTLMRTSAIPATLLVSANGQGNAPILTSEPPGMNVDIDIVPGSSLNVVSPKLLFVPVAILSANGFDALSDVDRSSLTFGKTGDEDSLLLCLSKGSDVNGDGRRDLICHFRFSLTGIAVGDTQAILKGQTLGGVPFEGMDSLRVSPSPTK
jgi:hypothetical protein